MWDVTSWGTSRALGFGWFGLVSIYKSLQIPRNFGTTNSWRFRAHLSFGTLLREGKMSSINSSDGILIRLWGMLIASGLVSRVKQNYSSQSWPSSASASSLLGSNIISIISIIRRWNQEPVRLRLCGINWHISELSGPHYDFQQLPLWHSSWSKETKGSVIFGYRWSTVSPIQPEIPSWLTSWLAMTMGENPWWTWK